MNLLDESYVRTIISDIETSQNRERREAEIRAFEIYSGSLHEHVYNKLMQIYPKTYKSFTVADLNLTKKICDKLSKAYKEKPLRELDSDIESEEYNALMRNIDSQEAFRTFDLYYNLHRHSCLWFTFTQNADGSERLLLRPLAPFQFSRKVNQYGDTELFVVNFPSNDYYETTDTDGRKAIIQDSHQDTSCKRYALWSKDQHIVVRYYESDDSDNCRIVYEDIEGNPEFINPLGVIPAIFAQQGDNCALPVLNPLPNQTIEYNHQYSVMLTGASLQTFGHLVLSHPEQQKMPDEIYNSLFTYSRLPQVDGDVSTTLNYLNPSPNLSSNLDVLSDYGSQIISEHLGDGAQTVSSNKNFTSGLDRMIAMSDITNIIESNQQAYAKAENDLYLIIKSFYEAKNDFRFKSENLNVKYNKAKPIQSETEILQNIEKKLNLGLIHKYEALLMLNPNMGNDAAKEKVEAVKQEKLEEVNFFVGDMSGDTNN